MPSTEQAVTEYFAAIRSMNPDRCAAVFASDAVTHDPVGAPPNVGQQAIRQFFTNIFAGFTQAALTEDHVFINGNSAAVKWTGKGVARNGKPVQFEGIDVIDCDAEGRITQVRAFWDPGPVMAILQS